MWSLLREVGLTRNFFDMEWASDWALLAMLAREGDFLMLELRPFFIDVNWVSEAFYLSTGEILPSSSS